MQTPNHKLLIIGSIFSSGVYALWGYAQSSGNCEVMKEEGAQNKILPLKLIMNISSSDMLFNLYLLKGVS